MYKNKELNNQNQEENVEIEEIIENKEKKISIETIKKIENFDHTSLTPEQELLLEKLVLNKELKERYKKFGLCPECQQPNTGKGYSSGKPWCYSCNTKHFQQNFKNWTGGSEIVDNFIQKKQLEIINQHSILEWIPYEQFTEIEYLAEGGFGKVYKAKWTDGYIFYWNISEKKWGRLKDREVVLKSLNNSQNITTDFLQEVVCHKLFSNYDDWIVQCYGISQNPITKDYLMVMEHMDEGNLRQYLQSNHSKLNFESKLFKLQSIACGLNSIHSKGLVHRDFHSGNILNRSIHKSMFIADLGLSRPINEEKQEDIIYGVLPYVAPEVLQGNKYTQASDVYSFGMVAYELFSGLTPYQGRKHDQFLIVDVCNKKLRPEFKIKIPKLLEDLIRKSWDAIPENRPTAKEIHNILSGWNNDLSDYGKVSEISQQIQEAEEFNKSLPEETRFPKYDLQSRVIYTSKPINTKQITELLEGLEIDSLPEMETSTLLEFDDKKVAEQQEISQKAQQKIPPKNLNK